MRANYTTMKRTLEDALNDLAVLAGDRVGPSDASWQDVAATAVVNLRALANNIEAARLGDCEPGIVFPSPEEALGVE